MIHDENELIFSSYDYARVLEAQTLLYARHGIACLLTFGEDGTFELRWLEDTTFEGTDIRQIIRDELPEMQRGTWACEFLANGGVQEVLWKDV